MLLLVPLGLLGLMIMGLIGSLILGIIVAIFTAFFGGVHLFVRFLLPTVLFGYCLYALIQLTDKRLYRVCCRHCQSGSLTMLLVMVALLVGLLIGRSG